MAKGRSILEDRDIDGGMLMDYGAADEVICFVVISFSVF